MGSLNNVTEETPFNHLKVSALLYDSRLDPEAHSRIAGLFQQHAASSLELDLHESHDFVCIERVILVKDPSVYFRLFARRETYLAGLPEGYGFFFTHHPAGESTEPLKIGIAGAPALSFKEKYGPFYYLSALGVDPSGHGTG